MGRGEGGGGAFRRLGGGEGRVDVDLLPNPFTNTLILRYCCLFFCPPTLTPPHCFQLLCAGSGTRQWWGPNSSPEHNDAALSAHLFIVPITFHKTPGNGPKAGALRRTHTSADFSADKLTSLFWCHFLLITTNTNRRVGRGEKKIKSALRLCSTTPSTAPFQHPK